MSTPDWYRYDPHHPYGVPPPVVQVYVQWAGREFLGARIRHPQTGQECWVEYKLKANGKHSADPAPVKLAGAPELWRPQHPELWKMPLPDPVTLSAAGQMRSERTSFALVDEAEASDLAREMERDRANAQQVSHETRSAVRERLQWWRDSSQIRYETKPDLTLRMVEGRLMRAVYNCGAVDHSGMATSSALRDLSQAVVRAIAEKEAQDRANGTLDIVSRMEPSPADAGDFLIAMSWFAALNPPRPNRKPIRLTNYFGCLEGFDYIPPFNLAQEVILRRAQNIPLSFDEIGIELFSVDPAGRDAARRIHAAGERARLMFKTAIGDCWKFAMGLSEPASNKVMEKVRERNREAKRRATA